jgi:magnesium transporter
MVYDDISQLIDFVESYEGTINSIRELYVAKVSLQINDTMRVLTIFTVILLPLTLIAGIYGMNGVDLSNLESVSTGFFIVIMIMASTAIGLLLFFIKKQWILVRPRARSEKENHKKTAEHNGHTKNKNSSASSRVWKNG